MFTGIITHTTEVVRQQKSNNGLTLSFGMPADWSDLALGESISTDGVCLTVAKIQKDSYDCTLVPETLAVTSFGQTVLEVVNLERSLRAEDRFGGHFVQGHVDGTGVVADIDTKGDYRISVEFDAKYQDLVVRKGSITINGVSLTVASVKEAVLEVVLVPHTLEQTTLGLLKNGDVVNLEFDMIGKQIVTILKNREQNAAS